jgi:hypothetical protein
MSKGIGVLRAAKRGRSDSVDSATEQGFESSKFSNLPLTPLAKRLQKMSISNENSNIIPKSSSYLNDGDIPASATHIDGIPISECRFGANTAETLYVRSSSSSTGQLPHGRTSSSSSDASVEFANPITPSKSLSISAPNAPRKPLARRLNDSDDEDSSVRSIDFGSSSSAAETPVRNLSMLKIPGAPEAAQNANSKTKKPTVQMLAAQREINFDNLNDSTDLSGDSTIGENIPDGSISDTSLSEGFVERSENLSALQGSVPFDSFDNEENDALLGGDSSIFDGLSVTSE